MARVRDFADIVSEMTDHEYEMSLVLTKQKRNTYRWLAFIFLCLGGIGLFLPFGKLAQLYSVGYDGLRGRNSTHTIWAFMGFIMSLLMGFLGKVFTSLITPRYIHYCED